MKMIIKMAEELKGGLGDGKNQNDFDSKQLRMGIRVEMEHTDSKSKAREIVMDHLTEDPKYYTKLNKAGL